MSDQAKGGVSGASYSPSAMYSLKEATNRTQVRLGVGVVITDGEGRVLLEKRSDSGCWGFLGGAVEPGETVAQACAREVQEESGLDVEILRLVGVYSNPRERIVVYPDNGDERHLIDIIVEAGIIGGDIRCSEESLELAFFSRGDLPGNIAPPAMQPLMDFLAGKEAVLL